MNKSAILKATEKYIKNLMEGEGSGHDWWHIHRVRNNAFLIAKAYKTDIFVIEMAALLHDIADHKFHGGDNLLGIRKAKTWMEQQQLNSQDMEHVLLIMSEVSFSSNKKSTTLESQIVQDADRLDAIGAIGIARTFAYGGHKNREIYNPNIPPVTYKNMEEYKKNTHPSLNHFYEKLLLLKDMMNTEEARKIAEKRHVFMEQFLTEFYIEWKGEA